MPDQPPDPLHYEMKLPPEPRKPEPRKNDDSPTPPPSPDPAEKAQQEAPNHKSKPDSDQQPG
ncbi:hypothetical protein DYQ86_06320 [Acidobacteria bacterium AB60]|nr:hypothetical protein DYQ86_06320 [Acidobacteria bacterium AB60]